MKKKRLVKVLVNILQRWIIPTISCFINKNGGVSIPSFITVISVLVIITIEN